MENKNGQDLRPIDGKLIDSQLLKEVNDCGYNYKNYLQIGAISKQDKVLIPVLLKHLKLLKSPQWKQIVVRSLGVRGFYDATETLLEEFHSSDNNSYKWAIGATIDNIKDKRYEDEYIKIINDKKNGTSRQMFVLLLGRLKSAKAIDSFINLLDDEDINGHIIVAMKYYKNKDLIPYIEPFLNHEKAWIRREAKKAISKLEK
ncbi:MAG TPA: HEAT repeat domain-containing protein [Bacilli bacterium]|nr:HEAT repeat domain-containing protein [Bacilli bacterium]